MAQSLPAGTKCVCRGQPGQTQQFQNQFEVDFELLERVQVMNWGITSYARTDEEGNIQDGDEDGHPGEVQKRISI